MAKNQEMISQRDLTLRFEEITRLALKGSEEEVLARLQSELLLARKLKKKSWITLGGFLFKFLPVVALLSALCYPMLLAYVGDGCLVTMGPFGEIAMYPKIDCGFCKELVEAPRVSNLGKEQFIKDFINKNIPIVVTDATGNWTAKELFSYEYFRDLYRDNPESLESDIDQGQFFQYSSDLHHLDDVFHLPEDRTELEGKKWYIGWSTDDPLIGKELRKHFSTPYFIPPQPPESNVVCWIFMGLPGQGAFMHLDNVEFSSWQAQLRGRKTWTLAPPPECESTCSTFNVTVSTGDMIVLNTNIWYHGTYIHPGSMSVTIGSEFE